MIQRAATRGYAPATWVVGRTYPDAPRPPQRSWHRARPCCGGLCSTMWRAALQGTVDRNDQRVHGEGPATCVQNGLRRGPCTDPQRIEPFSISLSLNIYIYPLHLAEFAEIKSMYSPTPSDGRLGNISTASHLSHLAYWTHRACHGDSSNFKTLENTLNSYLQYALHYWLDIVYKPFIESI